MPSWFAGLSLHAAAKRLRPAGGAVCSLDRRPAPCLASAVTSNCGAPALARAPHPRAETGIDPALINAALRELPDGVVWVDAAGIVVLINDVARALFGRARVGGHLSECVHEYGIQRDDGKPMLAAEIPLARALFRRERVVDEHCRIRRPNGNLVDVLATATPLDDGQGVPVGAMLVLRQMLPSQRAEGAQGRDERRFQALAAATAQMVWFTDAAGVVTVDSPSWRAFTGQSWEEYAGYGWLNAVHEEDRARAQQAWLAAVEARASYEVEYRTRRHDGVYRWMVARGTPVIDARGHISEWIGCNWDVHAIKDAERELGRTVEFQQMLLAIVGHDLRNPLNVISMGASLLSSDGSPSVRRTGERLARAAARASQITSLLLDLAEAELGRGLTLHREAVDLASIAKEVVAEHVGTAPGRDIVLSTSGDARANADPGRVAQLLANLIGNALHHGTPGTSISLSVQGGPDAIELAVENTAEEIPKLRREQLFKPFAGSTAPASDRRNLGLGLYIVKVIAEAHRGTVHVDWARGRVVFSARFPRT